MATTQADNGANSTLSLPDRMAIQEYCNQTKAVPFRLSSPAHKFDKVIVCSSGSTSRKYGIFPIKRPTTDDLLRGLFLRCRTKHLVLSLDDDWISPITGAEAYIPLLDLDSLDIGFSNNRIYDPKSIATALALALCSHNLARIILRGIGKIEPPPEYQDCTILRLLQHRKLTHLTLENSDITELISLQSPLETLKDSQIRILSIGPYEGEAKIADYEKAAGILIDGLADTLEELTLGVCPKLNSTLRPLHRLRILRLSVDFPIASILRTLKAFIIAGESNIQELHICCSEEKRQELGDVLSKFEPHTYPSLRKVTYREGQESPKELCKEADESGPERLWERFMAILQSSQS